MGRTTTAARIVMGVSLGAAIAGLACKSSEPQLVQAAQDYERECCACAVGDIDCCERAGHAFDGRACALGFDAPGCPAGARARVPSSQTQDTVRASRHRAHACSIRGGGPACGGIKALACPAGYRCVVDEDQQDDPSGTCVKRL